MPLEQETGLSPLLLPEPSHHRIDVVFVHGLNGHRSKSWTNQASELWPLWLREDLVGTRAWTYGYDASITIGSRDSIKLHSIRFLDTLVSYSVGKSVCYCLLIGYQLKFVLMKVIVETRCRRDTRSDYLRCP